MNVEIKTADNLQYVEVTPTPVNNASHATLVRLVNKVCDPYDAPVLFACIVAFVALWFIV